MAPPVAQSVVSPVLIGRGPALAALEAHLAVARSGQGETVLLSGEAGIGKSRLLTELEARATAGPAALRVVRGACFEQDRALPYAPILDALRRLAPGGPDALTTLLGPEAPDLLRILPEVAAHVPPREPAPPLEPAQEKRRLFEALARVVARAVGTGLLLLIVEDLHWSDESSLEWLLYLARRLVGRPILLLLTYRPEEVGPALGGVLATLDRERLAAEIPLARLDRAEVADLIRAIFDLPRAVHPEFVDALYALTEGNPFFVEETLKALLTAGDIFYVDGMWDRKPLADLHIPRTVQVAVQRRLDPLSPAARALILPAAVAGRRFDFAVLQAVTGQEEAALVEAIKELIAAGLVIEESADIFAFRHALTREAVYADLLARERRALHRATAAAIERVYAGALEAPLADLSYHYRQAGAWAQVLDYAARAGRRALALPAPRAAAVELGHALAAAAQLGQPPPIALYHERGQAYEALGEFDAAYADYAAARDAARLAGDRRAEWRSLLALGFLWTGRDYARAGADLQGALALARAMRDPAILASTLNRVGNWHMMREQPAEGRRYHEEALALFAAAGDRAGLAATLDLLGIANFFVGDLPAAAGYYAEAIDLFRALGDRQGLVSSLETYAMRGGSAMFQMSVCPAVPLVECLHDGEEAIALARQIGWRSGEASAELYLGFALTPRGEYAVALAHAQAGLALATEIEHHVWIASAAMCLGALYLDLGAAPEARAALQRALALAREAGGSFMVHTMAGLLALTEVAAGDLDGAAALLDAAAPRDLPMTSTGQRVAWGARAALLLARGDAAGALALTDRLIAAAPNVAYWGEGAIPRLWLLRGDALAALRRWDAAEVAYAAAARVAHAQGLRADLWRIQAARARAHLARGAREAAASCAAEAQALVDALAAGLPDPTLQATFRATAAAAIPTLAPPRPARAAAARPGGLTPREQEVARGVAQGLSNRALAESLVLSERTVEKHVENIMSKLGFASRAQIAAWAVETGLTPRRPRP